MSPGGADDQRPAGPGIVDVLVVGSGNAGVSAALSAHEAGASVLVIDKGRGRFVLS